MGQVEAIHEFVTGLNAEGRAILETQMSYRTEHGSGTTAPTAPLNDLEKLYWEILVTVLSELSLVSKRAPAMPFVAHRNLGRKRFSECATSLYDYVTYGCNAKLSITHRRAIMTECLRCLVRLMQRHNKGDDYIDPISVCLKIHVLPQAVDKAYPGYERSKLLHMIVPMEPTKGVYT